MRNNKSISILIGIIGILLVLLAGSIGYILGGNSFSSKEPSSTIQNEKVLKEVEELKSMYDLKIADKTTTYKALQEEKERVKILVLELEKTKGDANSLIKYKTEYQNLESKMKVLVNEIVILKGKKNRVSSKTIQPKSIKEADNSNQIAIPKAATVPSKKEVVVDNNVVNQTKKEEDLFTKVAVSKLEKAESEIEPVVQKSIGKKESKVTLSNVVAGAYISKAASKQVETNNANRTDLLKITFTIDGNPNVKSGDKTFYFQIINGKNNVLGKRITEFFDYESLTYSFKKSFDYNNESVTITQEFLQNDFQSGVYYVNIFDRDILVGKASFILK